MRTEPEHEYVELFKLIVGGVACPLPDPRDRQADNLPTRTARIKQLVERAQKLEQAELAHNPNNVDMLYARGATRAQFAAYTGLIERAWFSALRNAVGARHDHERVLGWEPVSPRRRVVLDVLRRGHRPEPFLEIAPVEARLAPPFAGPAASLRAVARYKKRPAQGPLP